MISKEHILTEIKRTAKANNGVPLGIAKFFKATGIKRADWEGRYWPRWSDAVSAAGLTPNPPQGAYSDEFLIEKLIGHIRELGHFPLRAEQAIRSRNDPLFPSPQTIQKRFGTRYQVAAHIVEYCRCKDGFEDVIRLCEAKTLDAQRDESSDTERRNESQQLGFVYLLKSGKYLQNRKEQRSRSPRA